MKKVLSKKAEGIPASGIRRFFSLATDIEDAISLGVGEPDFKTSINVRNEAINKIQQGKTSYTPNAGIEELRELIANYIKKRSGIYYRPESEIIITAGSSQALDIAFRSIVNTNDEIIIIEPTYVAYKPLIELSGGIPVIVNASGKDFHLNIDEIEKKITGKTKAILLCSPNNPTGMVIHQDELEALANIVDKYDLLVILDEIYAELVYEKPFVSLSALVGMKERCIIIAGFSKGFSMTGWRVGYLCAPKCFTEVMLKIQQYTIMSAPTIAQYAAIEALKSDHDYVEYMCNSYRQRRNYLVKSLNELGLFCTNPDGAFYVFPSIKNTGMTSETFCEQLLVQEKLAVIPGNVFGNSGEGHIRCSYAYSLKELEQALVRLENFLFKQ